MIDYVDIAEKVRNGRTNLGLTQAQLAEKADVSRHTVWRIESGQCGSISFESVNRVINAAGFDLRTTQGINAKPAQPVSGEELHAMYSAQYFSVKLAGDDD